MIVLITGGSGLVGSHLTLLLADQGHTVRHLSRGKYAHLKAEVFEWNLKKEYVDPAALKDVDIVVHLAGSNVGSQRWTPVKKARMYDSRILSTKLLFEEFSKLGKKPKLFLSASGSSCYGLLPSKDVSVESDPFGDDYLAKICKDWEAEADKFESLGSRVVKARFGMVLSENGSALSKITYPIKMFVGAPMGSGEQIINWVHIKDLISMLNYFIVNEDTSGAFNAVAPNPISNSSFTQLLAKVLKRPVWLPNVPSFILKMMLGEMSQIVLEGNIISNQKVIDTGFKFEFENPEKAIRDLLIKA
ncbi:MAG: TIGR01777 family oxidoreductase [Reichenbachiella sp.]